MTAVFDPVTRAGEPPGDEPGERPPGGTAAAAVLETAEADTAPVTMPIAAVEPVESEPVPRLVERLRTAGSAEEARAVLDGIGAAVEQGGTASRAEFRAAFLAGGFFREPLAAVFSEQEAERALRGLTAHAFTEDDSAVLREAVNLAAEPATPEPIREALLETVVVNGGARIWLDHYRPAEGPATTPVPKAAVAPPRPRRSLAVSLKEPAQIQSRFSDFAILSLIVLGILLLGTAVIFLAGSL